MLAEPSSGSYRTTYLPAGLPGGTGTGTGSSSDAVTHTRPVNCTLWRTVSLANRSSFCCRSPDTFTAPAEPRMSVRPARRTWREMILAARQTSYSRFDSSPVASGCSRSCSMMKRSIVMTSEPRTVTVRGESDRAALVGPEQRDAVRREPREHFGRRVAVAVVPAYADHRFVRRQLGEPTVGGGGVPPPSGVGRAPPAPRPAPRPAARRPPGTAAARRRTTPAAPPRARSHRAAASSTASPGSAPQAPPRPARSGRPPAPDASARPTLLPGRETRDTAAAPAAPPARAPARDRRLRSPPASRPGDRHRRGSRPPPPPGPPPGAARTGPRYVDRRRSRASGGRRRSRSTGCEAFATELRRPGLRPERIP